MITTTWMELLELARWAPSPHNVQPWKIKLVDQNSAKLYLDTSRTLMKGDPSGSFSVIGMGLFVETLKILAANRGLRLDFEFQKSLQPLKEYFIQQSRSLLLIGSLHLSLDSTAQKKFQDQLVVGRRTSRLPYQKTVVSAEVLTSLGQIASEWGQTFESFSDRSVINSLINWDTQALFDDLNQPDYHEEIVSYFRFTDRQSARTRDGLDFRCMNFSRFEFWASARLPWLLKIPGLRQVLKKRYLKQFTPVENMGWIAGPFWQLDQGFEAGRFLAHFWLQLTKYNLYMHPFGNLITNQQAFQKTKTLFGRSDVWLVFRWGHSSTPAQSRRLYVQDLLLD